MNNFVMGMAILIILNILLPFTRNHKRTVSSDITYTQHVRPILKKHCANCHNQNWPDKNWMDYDTAFKNKEKIKLRVGNQTMPPGNPTNMTKEERKTVIDWVDGGGKK